MGTEVAVYRKLRNTFPDMQAGYAILMILPDGEMVLKGAIRKNGKGT